MLLNLFYTDVFFRFLETHRWNGQEDTQYVALQRDFGGQPFPGEE
jgi:hypothetical protein